MNSIMALALPFSIGLSTIISILVAAGKIVYGTSNIAFEGLNNLKSPDSIRLSERCSEIIEDLQQMDHNILITGRSHRLVQTIVDCLQWSKHYDEKSYIKKIIFSNKYKSKFKKCHSEITLYYHDLVLSVLLIEFFPNEMSIKKSVEIHEI